MTKNSYFILALIALAVIVGGAVFYAQFSGKNAAAPTVSENQPPASGNAAPTTPAVPAQPSGTPSSSVQEASAIVTYTDSGYSPKIITVKKGTTVVFKNQSSEGMWTASNPHPVHTGYPTTGGCKNSTFDECRADPPGSSWSFAFDIPGTWGYHNHVDAGETGTVIVKP